MEDEKDLATLPAALANRGRIIRLSTGGFLVVQKWTAQKLIQTTQYLAGILGENLGVLKKALDAKDVGSAARLAVDLLGEHILGLIEISVRPEDRERVKDLDATEFLEAIEAVCDLNLTEAFLKKAKALVGRFGPLFEGKESATPSKAPTGASAPPG